ncbi:hypothetical protein ASG65_12150 [Bacillus sp. Leaf13]|nr:hypothetical protein ASG65_12150 [Bacillus sp. Leaf13]
MYIKPSFEERKEKLTRDEWWQIVVILFVLRVYSNYSLQKAIESCKSKGGLADVTSKFFGSSWEVRCIKK